jgi:glycosyltransferase involved in cell wall biosynthesis
VRILWFTDWQSPEVRLHLGLAQHPGPQAWVDGLAAALRAMPGVSLAIASPGVRAFESFVDGGVRYFHLPLAAAETRLGRLVHAWRHELAPASTLADACELVRRHRPDIVHVHGTEGGFGMLAGGDSPAPVVISLQGILQAYRRLYFAGRTPGEVAGLVLSREFLKGRGVVHRYLLLRRQAEREAQILREARWFIGRTAWDRGMLASTNPGAQYYHCDEIMRPEFYGVEWRGSDRHSARLYTTSSALLGKGTECLLEAVAMLERWGVGGLSLRVAGVQPGSEIDGLYRRRAYRLGVEGRVTWLGRLGAAQIVDELLAADINVYPSHVDNSPNALVEAMLVGVPSVASRTGGIPSLMKDGEEGLLVRRGDALALALAIKGLLDDRDLAARLGAAARMTARVRSDPGRIAARTLDVYRAVIDEARIALG